MHDHIYRAPTFHQNTDGFCSIERERAIQQREAELEDELETIPCYAERRGRTIPGYAPAPGPLHRAIGSYVDRVERHERATRNLRAQRCAEELAMPAREASIAPRNGAPPSALRLTRPRPDLAAMIEESLAELETQARAQRPRAWPILSLVALMPWLFL